MLEILKALGDAQKRGVEVTVMTDDLFRQKASGRRLRASASRLGLKIKWDEKTTILHEKTVLIDGETLLLGSHNWTNASLLENRELSILFSSSPSVLDAKGFSKSLLADIEKAREEITPGYF